MQELTPNERRIVELVRALKTTTGHGSLVVRVRDAWEQLIEPTFHHQPPEPPPAKQGRRP